MENQSALCVCNPCNRPAFNDQPGRRRCIGAPSARRSSRLSKRGQLSERNGTNALRHGFCLRFWGQQPSRRSLRLFDDGSNEAPQGESSGVIFPLYRG